MDFKNAQFRNWTQSRQPCSFQLADLSTDCTAAIVGMLGLSVFPKDTTDMPDVSIELATL